MRPGGVQARPRHNRGWRPTEAIEPLHLTRSHRAYVGLTSGIFAPQKVRKPVIAPHKLSPAIKSSPFHPREKSQEDRPKRPLSSRMIRDVRDL